jgi:hypothetical protein
MQKKLLAGLALALHVLAGTGRMNLVGQQLKQRTKGTISDGVYTNPEKDFRVRVPVHEVWGGAVRDESVKDEDVSVSEVVFTDDLGSFYRVVSLTGLQRRKINVYTPLYTLHDIREKHELQTRRGLELRIINVEKSGAEIIVMSSGKSERPDLVTANAIFSANEQVYHLVAGFPVYAGSTVAQITARAQKALDTFMTGFETLEKK